MQMTSLLNKRKNRRNIRKNHLRDHNNKAIQPKSI